MPDHTTNRDGDNLLPLARGIDAACAEWLAKLNETGDLDADAYSRMVLLRQSLVARPIENALDALVLCGALRCVAGFAYVTSRDDVSQAHLHESALELSVGLASLQGHLEELAGISLNDLGLFRAGAIRLQ